MEYKPDRLIVSIKHSGTRFLQEALNSKACHIHQRSVENIQKIWGDRTFIVPVKDPINVWASWSKRLDGDLVKEPTKAAGIWVHEFIPCWHKLQDLCGQTRCYLVPLDSKEKYKAIRELSNVLDERIDPTWGNHIGHIDGDFLAPLPEGFFDLYNLPIVRKYYENSYISKR